MENSKKSKTDLEGLLGCLLAPLVPLLIWLFIRAIRYFWSTPLPF